MSLELYTAYLLACLVVIIVPGPTVALILASSIWHGTRAGVMNVLGTQIGLAIMIAILGIGLTSLIEAMGHWFDWLRIAGAAYLVWLGWKMIRSTGQGSGANCGHRAAASSCRARWWRSATRKTLLFIGVFLSPIH